MYVEIYIYIYMYIYVYGTYNTPPNDKLSCTVVTTRSHTFGASCPNLWHKGFGFRALWHKESGQRLWVCFVLGFTPRLWGARV